MTAPVEPMTAEERQDLRNAPMGGVFSELRQGYATIDALRATIAAQAKVIAAADAMRNNLMHTLDGPAAVRAYDAARAALDGAK